MAIPAAVIAAGWIPFIVVIVLSILFSGVYVRYYMSKYDSEVSTTITAIVTLTIALLTSALVPVDIFLVSYMKDSDGYFKDWANTSDVRAETEETVLIAYYVLYGLVAFSLFFLLPFMYFFYEEKEDDDQTCKTRCASALKYVAVCMLIAVALFLIGAFVPTKLPPNSNSTDWRKIQALLEDMGSTGIEDALSFVMSVFSLIGMLGVLVYTSYGMSAMPMDLIKGKKNVKIEKMVTSAERADRERKRQERRERYRNPNAYRSRPRRGDSSSEDDALLSRREKHLASAETSWVRRFKILLRPFEVITGLLCFVLAIVIFLSLLLTNIDKALHSLGAKTGYALVERTLPNPMDIVLVFCQKAFPLDYIVMVCIIAYFVLCSMSGIRNIGIWFMWIRMYKIRPRRTSPQGLLMFCMILMFIVMAINIVVYELTPQYSSFGSEHYVNATFISNTTTMASVEYIKKQCTTEVSEEYCVVTRMTLLLVRFFYKMWVFGAAYYWLTWVFLGTQIISFIVTVVRERKSYISGEIDDDDFDESDDDDMVRA